MQNPGQFEENFYFASFNSQFAKGLSFLQTRPFDLMKSKQLDFIGQTIQSFGLGSSSSYPNEPSSKVVIGQTSPMSGDLCRALRKPQPCATADGGLLGPCRRVALPSARLAQALHKLPHSANARRPFLCRRPCVSTQLQSNCPFLLFVSFLAVGKSCAAERRTRPGIDARAGRCEGVRQKSLGASSCLRKSASLHR